MATANEVGESMVNCGGEGVARAWVKVRVRDGDSCRDSPRLVSLTLVLVDNAVAITQWSQSQSPRGRGRGRVG